MPRARGGEQSTAELIKDLMIVTLGLAGVKQKSIRDIVGCNIVRVNNIVRHLPKGARRLEGSR